MASRLFHTVVGFGIALGVATAGCASANEQTGTNDESALVEAPAPARAAAPAPTPAPAPAADAGADAAGPDWDAFCDATWPTTKGMALVPDCINPHHECQGSPADCARPVGAAGSGMCSGDYFDFTLTVCVDGAWKCKPEKVPMKECTCWVGEDQTSCTPETSAEPPKRGAAR